MKALIQRVKYAKCVVDNKIVGSINEGLLVFVGYKINESELVNSKMAKKIINLRIFEDENGKMNKNINDVNGKILCISQFTLYANTKEGNRPSFSDCLNPNDAKKMYLNFLEILKSYNIGIEEGIFQADMKVELLNDGPCTIEIEIN